MPLLAVDFRLPSPICRRDFLVDDLGRLLQARQFIAFIRLVAASLAVSDLGSSALHVALVVRAACAVDAGLLVGAPTPDVNVVLVAGPVVAAGPGVLAAIVDVERLRNDEVLLLDAHLGKSGSRLAGVQADLLQELVERNDQILDEVEVVVVHLRRHDDATRSCALLVQRSGVLA